MNSTQNTKSLYNYYSYFCFSTQFSYILDSLFCCSYPSKLLSASNNIEYIYTHCLFPATFEIQKNT